MESKNLIVLLAYNEAGCIAQTVQELRRLLPDTDVLVVDDGSADGTALQARLAGARVVCHPFNLGVAAGEASGLMYAARQGYGAVVRMDGDGQHDPASVPALVERLRAGADLVVGSRYLGLDTFRSTALRRFGNGFLSLLLALLSGLRVSDPTSGFRGFGPHAIALFSRVHPHDYPEPESVLMAVRHGLRVQEIPVAMRPRRTGRSSLTFLRSAYYMVKVSFALFLERLRTE